MFTRSIITAEQREQLKKLAKDLYKRNQELTTDGVADDYNYIKFLGAIELIASAYSFYAEDK